MTHLAHKMPEDSLLGTSAKGFPIPRKETHKWVVCVLSADVIGAGTMPAGPTAVFKHTTTHAEGDRPEKMRSWVLGDITKAPTKNA